MVTEIERKFLVRSNRWKEKVQPERCRQGYICPGSGTTVRVRVKEGKGYITIKGRSKGISRREYEFEIALKEAEEMLEHLCEKPLIEKKRYTVKYGGMTWEIDEFSGENSGLVIAEVELEQEDQVISLPEWAGPEVTSDPRYYNAALVKNPYSKWKKGS